MSSMPRSVPVFTGLLAIAAVAGAGALGVSTGWGVDRPLLIAPLLVALVLAGALQLSFQIRQQVEALDLFEAVLTPVVFLFAGPAAVVVAAAGKALSQSILGVTGVKRWFNVAQWAVATAAGSAVIVTTGQPVDTARKLPMLMVAMAVVAVVNHVSVGVVLTLVDRGSVRQTLQGLRPVVVPVWLVGGLVNIAFGVLFAAALLGAEATAVLVVVPLAVLHWAQRAYATARADRARLDGLQQATHLLAQPVDPGTVLPDFLEVVRATFGTEVAELVLFDDRRIERAGRLSNDDAAQELAEALVAGDGPVRVTAAEATPEVAALLLAAGHRSAIAAPLHADGSLVGALCAYDQGGFQGFSAGELGVLVALADEAEAALEKSRLLSSLVDERQKLAEIVNQSSDGIFTIDDGGSITSWNPAMQAITGYAASDIQGPGRIATLRVRDRDHHEAFLEQWLNGADLPADVCILDRQGGERWLSCSYSVSPGRDANGMLIVVARDVTRAREVDRLRDEFVATVSHELRTPLTTIRGFSTLLLEPPRPLTPQQQAEALGFIRKGARRLERLITNLLEVARVERETVAAPPRQALDVGPICARVVEEMLESSPHRRIDVVPSQGAARALAHELSVERIVVNLVSNALKFAPDGDPVTIAVEDDDAWVRVTVSDHGPGIPAGEEERIFGRFERVDLPGEQAGAGLGLYIARQLAESMGGELTTTPGRAAGASFTLRLPAEVISLVGSKPGG